MEPQQNPTRVCRCRWMASVLIRGAVVVCAAMVVVGMWQKTQPVRQFTAQGWGNWGNDRFSQAGRVYPPLRERLGNVKRVGFVCGELPGDAGELRYYMAQSMLAPTVVERTVEAATVIAIFDSEAELAEFVRDSAFRVRERVGNGVAILDRMGR